MKTVLSVRKIIFLFAFLLFCLCPFVIFAQNSSKEKLPHGYRKIQLGLSFEQAKAELKKEYQLGYRGERDVSLLPGRENRRLIETHGYDFFDRCWFQFYDEKLYIISLNFNPDKMDYYSLFKTLCDKYGEPDSVSPSKVEWQDETVILTLEKPLCLKYTDNRVYSSLIEEAQVEDSADEIIKENFLKDF